jgi:hypothetical protein
LIYVKALQPNASKNTSENRGRKPLKTLIFDARAKATPATAVPLFILAVTACLALTASGPAAHAQRFNFAYTGSLVTFTVPIPGTYQILAFGAQGGSGYNIETRPGGRGAEIGGDFSLPAGENCRSLSLAQARP